jgi:hypothetical protein
MDSFSYSGVVVRLRGRAIVQGRKTISGQTPGTGGCTCFASRLAGEFAWSTANSPGRRGGLVVQNQGDTLPPRPFPAPSRFLFPGQLVAGRLLHTGSYEAYHSAFITPSLPGILKKTCHVEFTLSDGQILRPSSEGLRMTRGRSQGDKGGREEIGATAMFSNLNSELGR